MANDEYMESLLIEMSRAQREALGVMFPVFNKTPTEKNDGPETP